MSRDPVINSQHMREIVAMIQKTPSEPRHVDDFIDDYRADPYARWMLLHFRLSADMHHAFAPFMADRWLFCTYQCRRYRVTGASRLGDVWLTSDFTRDVGYDLRVNVDDCSAWGAEP